ncbi:hypothetical protein, partial [Sphaerisporangium aureirubrum]
MQAPTKLTTRPARRPTAPRRSGAPARAGILVRFAVTGGRRRGPLAAVLAAAVIGACGCAEPAAR